MPDMLEALKSQRDTFDKDPWLLWLKLEKTIFTGMFCNIAWALLSC